MHYQEFKPSKQLESYVKCYYLYESSADLLLEDRAFATGCIELMFNLGTGRWQTMVEDAFVTTPTIELWGQIIRPLNFRSLGKSTMLGVRFFPHTAACFLHEEINLFNDQVTDFKEMGGKPVATLHEKLLEASTIAQRIGLLDSYLLAQRSKREKNLDKLPLMSRVMQELNQADFFEHIEQVAARYGISSRYLQKIFLEYTGLTPKLYSKINRFQNSLLLIAEKDKSLTSIAYDCGYFDQSHFIRDFKSFTGLTPSAFASSNK